MCYVNPYPVVTVMYERSERRRREEKCILIIATVAAATVVAAAILLFIGHATFCYASEKSEVDPVNREMVLKTRNLTFCNHIAVDETVKYTPHPNDKGKTLLKQEAVVTVSGVPLTDYMEELLTTKICFNSGMGRQAMEWVIEKLHLEEFDDILTQTVRQFDDLTSKTKKGMDDLTSKTKKGMDDLTSKTKKGMDDLTSKTKKGMDDLQSAIKSLDEIHNLTSSPNSKSIPKF